MVVGRNDDDDDDYHQADDSSRIQCKRKKLYSLSLSLSFCSLLPPKLEIVTQTNGNLCSSKTSLLWTVKVESCKLGMMGREIIYTYIQMDI